MQLNRGDIVRRVADDTGLPTATVDLALSSFFDTVIGGLASGDDVAIRRFGRFEPRHRQATVRKNPSTGTVMQIPPKRGVGFLPSANMKQRLNGTANGRRATPRKT